MFILIFIKIEKYMHYFIFFNIFNFNYMNDIFNYAFKINNSIV